jgi:glutathione peroxidase
MNKIIILILIMFSFFTKGNAQYSQLATDFSFKDTDGNIINLSDYKNKVILIVNVASRCGFTNQYKDLQSLWTEYKEKDLIVIGVPSNNFRQEPGSNKEIKNFCETTFGIDFPITEKIDVIGNNSHPFFVWAKKNYGTGAIPKWNFHKIIVGKNGKIVNTFSSLTNPGSSKFVSSIEKELKN